MPVLEAMTVGVPVVAANRGALPEVLGDAGVLVDPEDADAIAAAIERLLDDQNVCSGCRRRTASRARRALQLGRRRRERVYAAYRTQAIAAADAHRHRRARARGQPTGVGRYLAALLREWAVDERARTHEFVLYAPQPLAHPGLNAAASSTRTVAGAAGTWWEQVDLVRAAAADHLDVFFAPAYTAPLRLRVPVVVTIHDLSFAAHPEWFGLREGLRRRWVTQPDRTARCRRDHGVRLLARRDRRAPRAASRSGASDRARHRSARSRRVGVCRAAGAVRRIDFQPPAGCPI